MIVGEVNDCLEGVVRIVITSESQQQEIDAVIDTGFSGELTLPLATVTALRLTWLGREEGVLADGSVDLFDVYRATVIWDGQPRIIEVQAVNAQPLAGMALLRGHSLCIDVVAGGATSIRALP